MNDKKLYIIALNAVFSLIIAILIPNARASEVSGATDGIVLLTDSSGNAKGTAVVTNNNSILTTKDALTNAGGKDNLRVYSGTKNNNNQFGPFTATGTKDIGKDGLVLVFLNKNDNNQTIFDTTNKVGTLDFGRVSTGVPANITGYDNDGTLSTTSSTVNSKNRNTITLGSTGSLLPGSAVMTSGNMISALTTTSNNAIVITLRDRSQIGDSSK